MFRIGGLIAIVALVAGFGYFMHDLGRRSVISKIEATRGDAILERKVIDEEIRSLDEGSLIERAGRWLRPGG